MKYGFAPALRETWKKESEITLGNAVRRIGKEDCVQCEIIAANNDRGIRDTAFSMLGLRGVTIDFGGSTLLFDDHIAPFFLRDCSDVTLKNFTLDFSFTRYALARVTASEETYFEIEYDPETYSFEVDGEGHLAFRSGTYPISTYDKYILLARPRGGYLCYLFAGDGIKDRSNLPLGYTDSDAERIGAGKIRFTFRDDVHRMRFSVGEELLFHYVPRDCIDLFAQNCRNITLENVTILRSGAMGLCFEMTDGITLEGVRIGVEPGRDLYSTMADGLYFTSCAGKLKMRGCDISGTFDDGMNHHGVYMRVLERLSDTRLKLGYMIGDHLGLVPFRAGDRLLLSHGDTREEYGSAAVSSAVYEGGGVLLGLTAPTDAQPGDFIENETRYCDVEAENCFFHGFPHVRLSGKGRMRFSRCRFSDMELLIDDLLPYWGESGAVRDLLIDECTFTRARVTVCSSRASVPSHRGILLRRTALLETPLTVLDSAEVKVDTGDEGRGERASGGPLS